MATEAQQARQMLLILKGAVSELPQEDQDKVAEFKAKIQATLDEGKDHAFMAFAIIGAKIAIGS